MEDDPYVPELDYNCDGVNDEQDDIYYDAYNEGQDDYSDWEDDDLGSGTYFDFPDESANPYDEGTPEHDTWNNAHQQGVQDGENGIYDPHAGEY